jgi:DNA-binding transcriptional ArsR family regulator
VIYAEASPGRIAATPTSIPASTRTRCLVCKEPTTRASDLHWRHVDWSADCTIFVGSRRGALRLGDRMWTGTVHPLAELVAPRPDVTVSRWAAERLAVSPGSVLHPVEARVDYLAWASDHVGSRPQPKSKMRAAVRAAGGTPRGVGDALRYHDLALAGERPASPLEALTSLRDAGLVTDRDVLNGAYRDLSANLARLRAALGPDHIRPPSSV